MFPTKCSRTAVRATVLYHGCVSGSLESCKTYWCLCPTLEMLMNLGMAWALTGGGQTWGQVPVRLAEREREGRTGEVCLTYGVKA